MKKLLKLWQKHFNPEQLHTMTSLICCIHVNVMLIFVIQRFLKVMFLLQDAFHTVYVDHNGLQIIPHMLEYLINPFVAGILTKQVFSSGIKCTIISPLSN